MEIESPPSVLISGFGPFGIHKINASWESVKTISKSDIEKEFNVQLIIVEIPVVYDKVDELVPLLWKQYNPMLFIHVGVSAIAKELTLEIKANSDNYKRKDSDGCLPEKSTNCCKTECSEIFCKLNVEKICSDFNNQSSDVQAVTSCNAGRFLCEYTYFTSLSINPLRTLFIHVPDINKPYSVQQIAGGLDKILKLCLLQLKECKC